MSLAQLMQNLTLENDDNELKKCEQILEKAKETDEYFSLMVRILRTSSDGEVRRVYAARIRKELSSKIMSENSYTSLWHKIKDEIFKALKNESKSTVRDQLCCLIGEFGAAIVNFEEKEKKTPNKSKENQSWLELLKRILELWSLKVYSMTEAVLKIMATLFEDSHFMKFMMFNEERSEFYPIFKEGMEHNTIEIKAAAIEAMSGWLATIDSARCKEYVPLLMDTLLAVLDKNEDKGVKCLEAINRICKTFFHNNFPDLCQTMQKICSNKKVKDHKTKKSAVQVVVDRHPQENPILIESTFEITFTYMIETHTKDVTSEWINPKEGFLEEVLDESENSGVKFGCDVFDQMISWYGLSNLCKMAEQIISKDCSDWRWKFSGLMSLSRVGGYVKNLDKITPIFELAIKFLNNETHPKIRYAACHLIFQIADDYKPDFQIKFHQEVIPGLLYNFSDNVPRVLLRVLAAILKCLEGLPKDKINWYLKDIIEKIFPLLQQKNSLVQENSLLAISEVAEAAGENYQPYFEKSASMIHDIIQTHNESMYKHLRGQCIECIARMSLSIGKVNFKKYSDGIIGLMASIQMNDVTSALTYPYSEKIRKQAARCIPALLEVIKDSNHPNKQEFNIKIGQGFVRPLWASIRTESDTKSFLQMIHAMKYISDLSLCDQFMTKDEILEISSWILEALGKAEYKTDDNGQQENLHVGLAELIGILIKTNQEFTLPLVMILYKVVLPKALQPGVSDKMHKFGLLLINHMIEYLSVEIIPNEWPYLLEPLLIYATDKTCFVRQEALYGIRILALKSKDYLNFAERRLIKVLEALNIPKGGESESVYGLARDNAIAALGTIIQSSGAKLNEVIISKWLDYLPLQYDIPEGRRQHELLVDIILNQGALVFGQTGERLPTVMKILTTILETTMSNESIEKKISKIVQELLGKEETKALLENAYKQFTDLQKRRLEKVLTFEPVV